MLFEEGRPIRTSIARPQLDPATLRVAIHPQRDCVRVAVAGELDVANAEALQTQLDELRAAGFRRVLLDLRELAFMDSSGVRLIVTEDRLARGDGRRFGVIKGRPAVQRALDLCGVSDTLDVRDSVPAAPVIRESPVRRAGRSRTDERVAVQRYVAALRYQFRSPRRLST